MAGGVGGVAAPEASGGTPPGHPLGSGRVVEVAGRHRPCRELAGFASDRMVLGGRGVRYEVELGLGFVRAVRCSDAAQREVRMDDGDRLGLRRLRALRRLGKASVGTGSSGMSAEARMRLRRLVDSLPWAAVSSPIMVTLTYPGEWRDWVPDAVKFEAHRRAFIERWARRYGRPSGLWVKEFQKGGRPHLHFLLGLPRLVTADEYEGLRQRTLLQQRLESMFGKREGRGKLPTIGRQSSGAYQGEDFGGEFAYWLREAWSSVVGTSGRTPLHHGRGVDVTVVSWSEEARRAAQWEQVSDYLAKEASKWGQKVVPEGFGRVVRFYGLLRGDGSFQPDVVKLSVDEDSWQLVVRVLSRYLRVYRGVGLGLRQPTDGLTAYRISQERGLALVRWAHRRVAARRGHLPLVVV